MINHLRIALTDVGPKVVIFYVISFRIVFLICDMQLFLQF